jgi:hypothetical protein
LLRQIDVGSILNSRTPGTKQGLKVKVWLIVPIQFELPR